MPPLSVGHAQVEAAADVRARCLRSMAVSNASKLRLLGGLLGAPGQRVLLCQPAGTSDGDDQPEVLPADAWLGRQQQLLRSWQAMLRHRDSRAALDSAEAGMAQQVRARPGVLPLVGLASAPAVFQHRLQTIPCAAMPGGWVHMPASLQA